MYYSLQIFFQVLFKVIVTTIPLWVAVVLGAAVALGPAVEV